MKVIFVDNKRGLLFFPDFEILNIPQKNEQIIFHNLDFTFKVEKVVHNFKEGIIEIFVERPSIDIRYMFKAGWVTGIVDRITTHQDLP